MSLLAPTLQAFFTDRLITQRDVSPSTVAAYRDTFRLLLAFVEQQTGKQPYQLDLADLDAPMIGVFLTHLEQGRHNTPRTRPRPPRADPFVLSVATAGEMAAP
jgi:integrase/recombinase XerD